MHNDGDDRVILTPDRRLRVFISSTIGELAEERQAASSAIEDMRMHPILFELGARPHPPRDLYRAYLAQSDIFVGIYWQSYGWVAPEMDISGIEDEFMLSEGMPRLIYVKTPAPDRQEELDRMLAGIANAGVSYRKFADAGRAGAPRARRPRGPAHGAIPERAGDRARAACEAGRAEDARTDIGQPSRGPNARDRRDRRASRRGRRGLSR